MIGFIQDLPTILVREIEEGRAAVVGGAVRAHFDGTEATDIDVFVFSKENHERLARELGCQPVPGTGNYVFTVFGPNGKEVELVFDPECPDVRGCRHFADFDIGSGVYSSGRFFWDDSFPEAVRSRTMHVRITRVHNPRRSYCRFLNYNRRYGYVVDGSIHELIKLWRESTA